MKNGQVHQKLDLINFLTNPPVVHIIPSTGKGFTRITVLGSQVFVIRYRSEVFIYNSTSFTSTKILIPGSQQLRRLVSCSRYNCLYTIDSRQRLLYRYDLSNNVTTSWSVNGNCWALSVTKSYKVLVTLYTGRIQEYTTNASLIREISLDGSISSLLHCVQLNTQNYAVCHTGCENDQVCIVNTSGHIIQSYGTSHEAGIRQRNYPCHLNWLLMHRTMC